MLIPVTGGVKFYTFTQDTPSIQWDIYHAFGTEPTVDVAAKDDMGVLQKAFPLDIIQIDVNTVRITWSSPRAGVASLASTVA